MASTVKIRLFAAWSLGLGGLILIGIGLYFAFLRPPLLPEDVRYLDASLTEIHDTVPRLGPWLGKVFSVLGGFMAATGLLTIYIAVTGFKTGASGAQYVVVASGLVSIGWMAATNFFIDSDSKWLLLILTLPWLVALGLGLVSSRPTAKIP